MSEHCPAPRRAKCSGCIRNAIGRCDHCHSRFEENCFSAHVQTCPGARHMSSGRLTLKPECQFCSNDATGKCSGCRESVCSSCFEHSHRVHRLYRTQSDSSSCNLS
ncbi:unnamed protein product [Adineta ricciae]|uniref:Uncharacterized protein n=1 Tax=Adineta ricciae TaxID=249248 RepID=A0A815DUX0_ADIRI|nr:unnamed protein product [Adineta ricciae]CAF1531651.1 unnamed protein product [Adineta ricciae]